MEQWNRLLKRQIWKHFGKKEIPEEFQSLMQTISNSYSHFEKEREFLERTMDLSSDELLAANAELRKRNEELDRFVYSTSHDLRAPLTSILGLIEIIEFDNKNTNARKYLDLIKVSALRLDNFIQDIVSYTQNRKIDIAYQEIDFADIFKSNVDKLDFMPNAKFIEKTIDIQKEAVFNSDPNRLDKVLGNLLSNSIKYYNPNCSDPYIKFVISQDHEQATICVEDNGIGIKEDYQKNIFDMFYRASDTAHGSGLGLYIVKEIVEKLSGEISVKSRPGHGTTFKIIMPNQNKIVTAVS